ncbi:hypothetical protein CAEBREN_07964 [Caenorhabditis brenneri]|uniref:Uncharacterized protein n=1 Tax=Caenorhabditis brenneri TaxID=135651 RepID=G0N6E2_CAEBE|nr:hypothetical protein CAEBREN_07964 [Caenorhabditis brenneri]
MLDFFPWLLHFDRAFPCCHDTFNSRQSHIIYTVTTCFTYKHTYIMKLQITYIKCDKIGKNPKICRKIVEITTLFSVPDFDISVPDFVFSVPDFVFSVPDFDTRSPIFGSPIFRATIFRSPIFRATIFRSPIFRATIFRSPIFRSPILIHGPRFWNSAENFDGVLENCQFF